MPGHPCDDEELSTQVGSEAGQRLNDPSVRVVTETLGDRLVEVLDLAVHSSSLLTIRFTRAAVPVSPGSAKS
jgi:hypothetical protein